MDATRPIMVLGASGVFGSRVCRLLLEGGADVVAVARRTNRLEKLHQELGDTGKLQIVQGTLPDDLAPLLIAHRPAVVIDAAGPFQGRSYRVPRACIDHGVTYLDLSDGREDVSGILALDNAARNAGVTILSGVSTVCAVTSAVIDHLKPAFDAIDTIEIAIAPGNDAPRGPAVTSAVLSWVGKPVPRWSHGRQTTVAGWQELHRRAIGSLGKRWLATCDVPDNVLLAPHYGARHVRLYAGMELRLIHFSLWLLSWPVRLGLIGNLAIASRVFQPIANALRPLGTNTGGMAVSITGTGTDGRPLHRLWTLEAREGDGPMVPASAAASLTLATLRGQVLAPGAHPCLGEARLTDILDVLAPYAIHATTQDERPLPLYRQALGEDFERLPRPIRAIHDHVTSFQASGLATITLGRNTVARCLQALGVLPKSGTDIETQVTFTIRKGRERWTRRFAGFSGSSVQGWPSRDHVWEKFGLIAGQARFKAHETGLDLEVASYRFLGIPVPRFLWLRAWGYERVDDQGRFTFDVGIGLPFGIDLVTYKGWLVSDDA